MHERWLLPRKGSGQEKNILQPLMVFTEGMMEAKRGGVAIVTGGSNGIGKGCSLALAECGIGVVILDKKREEGLKTADELNKFGVKAIYIQIDVSDQEQVRKSVARVYNEFQRIDILVNGAGIVSPLKYFFEQTDDDWDQVIKVHLYGTYYMMKEVTPVMMKQKYGRIVNISSIDAIGVPISALSNIASASKR